MNIGQKFFVWSEAFRKYFFENDNRLGTLYITPKLIEKELINYLDDVCQDWYNHPYKLQRTNKEEDEWYDPIPAVYNSNYYDEFIHVSGKYYNNIHANNSDINELLSTNY